MPRGAGYVRCQCLTRNYLLAIVYEIASSCREAALLAMTGGWRKDEIQITRSQRIARVRTLSRHDDLWRDLGLGRLENRKQKDVRSLRQRGRQLHRYLGQLHRWHCRRIPWGFSQGRS